MADRFPLVVDPSNFRVEEIASADNLNLSGSEIIGINSITFANGATLSGSTGIGSTLRTDGDILVHGLTVGRGGIVGVSSGSNTALGINALASNTTGSLNTGIGHSALCSNTTGNYNTATGLNALCSNTTGFENTTSGYYSLLQNTTGNSNTATGVYSIQRNTTGINNTATGSRTLLYNTTGSFNTANGANVLSCNTTGVRNTGIGVSAHCHNTTGFENTATGFSALLFNTTGYQNVAIGAFAGCNITTGALNTAVGVNAMRHMTTGQHNAAFGYGTLGLQNNPTNYSFCNSTAIGSGALGFNQASDNTAIGASALYCNTTGSNNIGLGMNAGLTGATPAGIVNITTESNRIVIGNDSHTCAQIKIAFTAVSDCRDKMCFKPIPHGLEFVGALKPTEYQFKSGGRDSNTSEGKVRYGFLAQDILPLEGDHPVIISNDDPDKLQYTESHLIPVLVKAIQQLNEKVQELSDENQELKDRLDAAGL